MTFRDAVERSDHAPGGVTTRRHDGHVRIGAVVDGVVVHLNALLGARHFERDPRLRERAFRTHDALPDGGLRHEEGARNFPGSQPSEQAERQRRARFRRKHWVTGDEDQS